MNRPCLSSVLIVVSIVVAPAIGFAQKYPWKGRQAIPKMGAQLTADKKKVAFEHTGQLPWRITQVNGDWLWVGEGWIKSDQVVAAEEGVPYFDAVIRRKPKNAEAYVRRGIARLSMGTPIYAPGQKPPKPTGPTALDDFNQAVQLDPNHAEAHYRRALLRQREDEEHALDDYDVAIKINPRHAHAYFQRGFIWEIRGQHAKALDDFDRSIQFFSKDDAFRRVVYGHRAQEFQQLGEWAKALADLNEAVKHLPKTPTGVGAPAPAVPSTAGYSDPWLLIARARLLASCPDDQVRDGRQAVADAQRACELTRDADMAVDALAMAYAEVGDFAKAVETQERANPLLKKMNPQRLPEAETRLALYRESKPYREGGAVTKKAGVSPADNGSTQFPSLPAPIVEPLETESLPDILTSLKSDDAKVRAAAAEAIGRYGAFGDPICVKTAAKGILPLVADDDVGVRESVARSLGELKRGTPELAKALKDPEPRVRFFATAALGSFAFTPSAEDAKTALQGGLTDADSAVRAEAAASLINLDLEQKPEVVPVLLAMASDEKQPSWLRGHALSELLAADITVEQLRPLAGFSAGALDDEDGTLRIAAAGATAVLGEDRQEQAIEVLLDAATGGQPGSPAEYHDFAIMQLAIAQLKRVAPAVLPAVQRRLASDKAAVRYQAIGVLAQLGAPALPLMLEKLSSDDADERMTAAMHLGTMGPAANDAADALIAAISKSPGPQKGQLLHILAGIDPERAVAEAKAHVNDPEVQARVAALYLLVNIAPRADETRAAIRQALDDVDRMVRNAAVSAAAQHSLLPADSLAVLVECLDDPDPWAVHNAAEAIRRLNVDAAAAIPALAKLLDDSNNEKRITALRVLLEIAPAHAKAAIPWLTAQLNAPSLRERVTAAQFLLRVDPSQAVKAMPVVLEGLRSPVTSIHQGGPVPAGADLPPDPVVLAISLGDAGPIANDAADDIVAVMTNPETYPFSRFHVAAALAKIAPERKDEALDVVREMVYESSNPFIRVDAAPTLVQIEVSEAPHAVETVLDVIKHRQQQGITMEAKLTGRAMEALRAIAERSGRVANPALAALQSLVKDPTLVVASAAEKAFTAANERLTARQARSVDIDPGVKEPAPPAAKSMPPVVIPSPQPAVASARFSGTLQADVAVKDGQLELELAEPLEIPEMQTRAYTVNVGGRQHQRQEAFTVTKTAYKTVKQILPLAAVQAFKSTGEPVENDALANLLKATNKVLVCPSEEEIDDAYLGVVLPDVLVLKLLPQPIYAAGAPRPIPANGPAPSPAVNPASAPAPANAPAAAPASASAPSGQLIPMPRTARVVNMTTGLAPRASWAVIKDGKLLLRRVTSSSYETTGMCTTSTGDEQVSIPATITRAIRREFTDEYDVASVEAFTANGEAVSAANVSRRLAKETAVVISIDGREVSPEHLQIIKDDALVLVPPSGHPPAMPLPPSAPPPPS